MLQRKLRLYIKLFYGIIVLASFGIIYSIYEYCEQIEPPVRMIEPASAINRATQCNRESH